MCLTQALIKIKIVIVENPIPLALQAVRNFDIPTVENMYMSVCASTASCSDAWPAVGSEFIMSNHDSADHGDFEEVMIPPLDLQ